MPKQYPSEVIQHALERLKANGNNVKKTGAELGIARSVITSWRDGTRRLSDAAQAVATTVGVPQTDEWDKLAAKWERIAASGTEKAAELIDGTKSFKEAVIGSAVATEKALLLRGKPTTHQESVLRIELIGGGSLQEMAERTMRQPQVNVIDGEVRALPEPN
jgi:hypothetical protein